VKVLTELKQDERSSAGGTLSDLDFLNLQSNRKWIIEKYHTTVVTCGWDDLKFAVFSFDSRAQTDDDEDDSDDDEDESEEEEESSSGISNDDENYAGDDETEPDDAICAPKDDIISSNTNRTYVVDSPIQNARLYWLRVIEGKARQSTEQWRWLVGEIGESVKRQVCGLPCTHNT
jgi:hypothetical protein